MKSVRIWMLLAIACVLPTGCALTVPLVGHDFTQYSGDTLEAKNPTYLIANEAMYPRYQIRAGRLKDGDREICKLPAGTLIEFRSFWQANRVRALGAPIRSDYALVMVETPEMGRVAAELPMSDLDAVFDDEKRHSKASKTE